MASVQKSVEVDVPVSTAYNQWTQFETFPAFITGVESRGIETGEWRSSVDRGEVDDPTGTTDTALPR